MIGLYGWIGLMGFVIGLLPMVPSAVLDVPIGMVTLFLAFLAVGGASEARSRWKTRDRV